MRPSWVVAVLVLFCVWQSEALGSGLFGIDLGTDSFKVMTMSGNAPAIVLNDQSGRKTDSLVGFTPEGERVFGSSAAQLVRQSPFPLPPRANLSRRPLVTHLASSHHPSSSLAASTPTLRSRHSAITSKFLLWTTTARTASRSMTPSTLLKRSSL